MNQYYFPFSVFLVLVSTAFSEACKGCLNLDEYNFYKVVPKFEAVLVKFDVAYPYGDKHEVFNGLATELVDTQDLVLGQVAIKDYGEKDNEGFSKKFGINTKEDLPCLRLFVQGEDEPFSFEPNMPWTNENLKKFIRDHTAIYLGLPGCIEKFDRLALRFASDEEKEGVLKETQKEVDKLVSERDKEIGNTYVKIMKKVIKDGDSFVSQENSRLEKILKGKVSEKKRLELSHHQNVLKSFNVEHKRSEL